ncbi:hypothetical protein N7466_007012 [Penicillium verhagenii]|uniref:uncharacterized protein n=1 Tax=Penicillium verhagenii TaxID=1562060 RepID=UPI00254596F3|nr:uncharacterized protein N7466_007012 [Penicillium verhagenii]KAJ5928056.1 hypothetical protein N7466_007012 [Penicillium verhagenii]
MAIPQENENILIRRMQSSDIPLLGPLSAKAYCNDPLNTFLFPRRLEHPNHMIRRFAQGIQARYLNPRNIGFVAVDLANPSMPVAYAQFVRLGDDKAALQLIANQRSFGHLLKAWWFKIRAAIENFFWPDRSVDPDAMSTFMKAANADKEFYWDSPEMKIKYGNRWHAQSVVVSAAYRRQGIGRRLVEEVLRRAQDEGVVVGLEASKDGATLYRTLGFELRGPFSMVIGLPVGGIMMWSPKGLL